MTGKRCGPPSAGALSAREAVETLPAPAKGEGDEAAGARGGETGRVVAARDASEPFRRLLEGMSHAALVLDDGVAVYCNGVLPRALGRPSVLGARIADLVVAEDRARFEQLLRAGARRKSACEAALRKANGAELPARMAAAPFSFDGSPRIALEVTPLEDIASWRSARSRLVESERRFQVALGKSPVVVFEQDLDLRYTWIFNPKLGLSAHDVLGRADADLLEPAHARNLERIKRQAIAAGAPVRAEVQAAAPGGPVETYDLRVEPRRDGAGRIVGVIGAASDITERKKAEEALRESEERYRVLHEGLRDAFAKVTMDGAIVEFNAAFQEMLGYAPDELRTLTYRDVTPERWRAFEEDILSTQVLPRGFSDVYEKEYRRKDGTVFPVELRTILMRDARGRPCAMWAIVRDISARKLAETALARAMAEAERANVAKSSFLAAASHDLRQPVQSLMLLLPLVERHIDSTPKGAQIVGLMGKALGGLNVLLNAVLDVSRLDAGGIEPRLEIAPLRGLCERLAAEYAPKAAACGLDLRVHTLDLCARTDPALLERVLRNLIENALRYTRAGGVLLALRRRGDKARIDVIDTGIGVPADKQAEIFQEFTQLDNPGRDLSKGLGLGLAIVARISALLDLNVTISSKVARGSRFSIFLPVAEQPAPKPAQASEVSRRSGSVLVIEDNHVLRLAIEAILSECGYRAIAAASGEEAIALAENARRLDAIVTDYRLGAGLTGVEAAREIERRLGRKVAKLLLTGETANLRLEDQDLSAFEFLYKPISAERLQAKLAAMLTPP
jgi:PAS domain S-box-containing protein